MQELLGRIARLDPSASLGLRVIACFDELVVGNVNTRALLASAASLAACPAGFRQRSPARTIRITPDGHHVPPETPTPTPRPEMIATPAGDLQVWLEREGPAQPNDAIILERLALAVRIRHGHGRREFDNRRHFGLLVDETVAEDQRLVSATALGLDVDRVYRVAAAPLFAVWESHPSGPEDVVPTRFGPIHAVVVPADTDHPEASPCGVGIATRPVDLHRSFRTALVALRLCEPPTTPLVRADDLGGLVGLLADTSETTTSPDVERLAGIMTHPWGLSTVKAVISTATVRQAARVAGVHHSTMQDRIDTMEQTLGFDPLDGFGRTRLGTAHLMWRLRTSHVLELPPPKLTTAP
ncbi:MULTISPECIES: hypothetical protein [unclassified Aeromicrobium]|uniref:hypothetical protein n=1 Tax=unclassified Aeromicrobium TaxID=2633570 RepID=UPI00288A04CC|nr:MULTISPECIES: hypothetical protein [unclassified Aeromicrobium]